MPVFSGHWGADCFEAHSPTWRLYWRTLTKKVLNWLSPLRYQIPEDWSYQEARHLFKEPLVFGESVQPEIKWTSPDEEGLVTFLGTENGFNIDRVTKAIEKIKAAKGKASQGRLESFFKPVVSASVPIKRKEPENATKEATNKKSKGGGGSGRARGGKK